MNNDWYLFFAIAAMAVTTYIIRVIPFFLFDEKFKSKWIRSFLYYIPYTVLAAMTFPTIFYATGNVISSVVGTVVAMVLAITTENLLIVSFGAAVVSYIMLLIV